MGRAGVLACLAVAALLSGCRGDGSSEAVTVEMFDNRFDPATLTVEPGTEVTFENLGMVPHDARAVDGSWETPLLDPGEEATITVEGDGPVAFFCSLHAPEDASSGMVGELILAAGAGSGAGGDGAPDAQATDDRIAAVEPVATTGEVRRVPDDFPTIQTAVDAAEPGDLVLIDTGTYPEQVTVSTEQIVVRGVDREGVVVDGQLEREMGIMVTADGVAVENLTVRDVTANGVYWDGVTGFRGSYLTALNAGTYGIYAFDSVDGVFEESYASGSADGGYYVGQCEDCRTVLHRVTAEWNGFGFSGTNASNSLYLVGSVWRHNGAGIVPNTLDSQLFAPSRGATIAGNLVHDNGNFDAPVVSATWPAFGHGIVLAGGIDHDIRDNVVVGHPGHGIATTPNLHRNFWMPGGNRIADNVVAASGRADLATLAPAQFGGDCFDGNEVDRAAPALATTLRPCDGAAAPSLGSLRDTWLMVGQLGQFPGERRAADVPDLPGPPDDLPDLPEGAEAEVRPAVDVFATFDAVDLDAIGRPEVDVSSWTDAHDDPVRVLGFALRDLTGWPAYFVAVGWLLPLAALLGLAAAAIVDTVRREDLTGAARAVRAGVVVGPAVLLAAFGWPAAALTTLVASVTVLAAASPRRTTRRRWTLVGAGLGTLLLVTPALIAVGAVGAGVL